MIALDTNVLVRLITKDDVEQTRLAAELLAGPGPFWVGREVLLETGWALKSAYKYTRDQANRALEVVARLDKVQVEDRDRILRALHHHASGVDLGDAFILAFAPEGAVLATFDDSFVKRAATLGHGTAVMNVRALKAAP